MRNEASSSNNSSGRGETVVADCGLRRSTCGYCRTSGRKTSIAHGLWVDSLTVDDYQDLLDQGWRRSGCFLYKPNMKKTCCPSYTIRLKAHDFVPSKEQRRVSRRIQRYLEGTLDVKKFVEVLEDPSTSNHYDSLSSVKKDTLSHSNEENNKAEQLLHDLSVQINNAVHTCIESGDFPSGIQLPKASVKIVSQAKRKLLAEGMENLLYSSNIAFQVAATLRRAQLAEKEVQQIQVLRQNTQDNGPSPKVIAEKLASSLNKLIENSGLSIRACNGHLNFYSAMNQSPSDNGIQIAILSEESSDVNSKRRWVKSSPEHPQGKRHRLQIHLKRSSFDPQEYALYRRYQIKVHHDKPDQVNENSYRRFLVDTPLVFVPPSGDATVPPCGFGSFHQQYLIDDRLVAVGVIDILPRCLSSKYLFWDPDFAFLSLGKYSALQEIGWVKENQVHCLPLEYYYLGYYIHSCRKMRYKAAYRPSELLCPLRYQWVPYDVVLSDFASLQNQEASSPSVSANATELQHHDIGQADSNDVLMDDEEEMLEPESESDDDLSDSETSGLNVGIDGDITNILIGLNRSRVRYKDVQEACDPILRRSLESQLPRYLKVVGAELSKRMVYSLG
ncbi:arginyl-tRNA--protein transferase 2-like isoform X1 [Mangifera indica]|uniref:arginyl-tRNA--protein transferase 2-like isoform X1 n=2 Tax=Mangifera indica TaxID=29780 RepID=UPI001CFB1234|nr:arginyl-tRNA--protein transferase 2-like isoform X1 [Mangifera indica]